MFLYLNEYGYKVSKNKEFLVVEHSNGEKDDYHIGSLSAVYLSGEGRISKAIMLELTKRNIDLILLASGKPLVYLYPTWVNPKAMRLLKMQMQLNENDKKSLAKTFVLNAIKAKATVLNELYRSRKRTNKNLAKILLRYRNRIRGIEKKVRKRNWKDFTKFRNYLRGLEGFSAKLYFEVLKYIIPENFNYKGTRTRRPPKDLFNAAISYGYAHLKYFVEKGFLLKGINPYYGYLHQEADKIKPFLAFDMMEGFRHTFIDKTILNLIAKRILVPEKHMKLVDNGVHLTKRGRELVHFAINKAYFSKFRKLIYNEINSLVSTFYKQKTL